MAGYEDELLETLHSLNRNIGHWFGGKEVAERGSAKDTRKDRRFEAVQRASGTLAQSLRTLHGDTTELSHSFRFLIKSAAVGELINFIVDTTRTFVRTYNQLSDVGQMFQGSLAEMMKNAGQAGLSLDEYAKTITKNSTLYAVMGTHQEQTGRSLTDLQKSVRATLKPLGFYGMSLTEVTDIINDVADVYRQAGRLYELDERRQSRAIGDFSAELTALAQVSGKSRQEIMKNVKQTMQDTGSAAMLAVKGNKDSVEALSRWSATMSTMAPEMSSMLNKAIVTGSAYLTEEGQEMVNAGMGDIVQMIQDRAQSVLSGHVPTLQEQGEFGKRMQAAMKQHMLTLGSLAASEPGMAKYVAMAGRMAGIDWEKITKAAEDQENYMKQHPWSRMALTFEASFHELIGRFQEGLYSNLLQNLMPDIDPNDEEQRNKAMKRLGDQLYDFGTAIGGFIVSLKKLKPVLDTVIDIFMKVSDYLKEFREQLTGHGVGEGWATLITATLPFLALKIIKSVVFGFLKYFLMRGIYGAGGGALAALGAGGGGLGGLGALMGGGLAKSMFSKRLFAPGRMLAGAAVTALTESIGSSLPDFAGKDAMKSALDAAGVGFAIAGIQGAIIGAVAGFLVQSFEDAQKRLADPNTYSPDSPFWRGMPESEQIKYKNSPLNQKRTGQDQYNPNPYHWWNPGSWLHQRPADAPAVPALPGQANINYTDAFAVQRRIVELQKMQSDDLREVQRDRDTGQDPSAILQQMRDIMDEVKKINESHLTLSRDANDSLDDIKRKFDGIPQH